MEKFDLIILGGGSGGLVVAAVAAQLGYKVALLEGHKMGGDCLNYGCIPSKALLHAAKIAHTPDIASAFGVDLTKTVHFAKVMAHVQDVIAQIEPHDSVARFSSLGVRVILEYGQFATPNIITTPSGQKLTARRIVIATGSRAVIPPIPGLADAPYFTNESIFQLQQLPEHLGVLGGGPIGVELAQAFRRFGSEVTVFEAAPQILAKDAPELVQDLATTLTHEGVRLLPNTHVHHIKKLAKRLKVCTNNGDYSVSHLLVAAGRQPVLDTLNLDAAQIAYTPKGIQVTASLQTTQPHIYALGDVTGGAQFTHQAAEEATVFIQKVLFGKFWARVNLRKLPWVTYSDPELAHVGLTYAQAVAQYGPTAVRVTKQPVCSVDRYIAERATTGALHVITKTNGQVLGVDILAKDAGELITPWALLIARGGKLSELSGVTHPYPTKAEVNRKVVSTFYAPKLYAPRTQTLSKFLFRWLG